MILITTPTGDIGSRVLDHVTQSGEDVRVLVRSAAKLRDGLSSQVDIVEGSNDDPAAIAAALDGASAVFWLPPGDPTAPDANAAYVEFSRRDCQLVFAYLRGARTLPVRRSFRQHSLSRGRKHRPWRGGMR